MAYKTISGTNGSLRINYTETVNESSHESTITVTSIQAMVDTNGTNVIIIPWGYVSLGGRTITLNELNQGTCANRNSYGSFTNIGSLSATFANNGTNSTGEFVLAAGTSESYFKVIYGNGYDEGNAYIPVGTHTFSLTPYVTNNISTITATNPTNLGSNCTININKSKASYTHTLAYSFNRSSWTTIVSKTSSTSYNWSTSGVASYFSTSAKQTVYLRCTTYNGNTSLGSSEISIEVRDTSTSKVNSVTITPINDNTTVNTWNTTSVDNGTGYIFLQGYSRLNISAAYSLSSGTSVRSVKVTVNGVTIQGATYSNGTITCTTTEPITDSGSVPVVVSLTDSRELTALKQATVSVYAYSKPYATAYDAHRYSTSVNTENKSGTNISAKASFSCTSVNGFNSVGCKVRYKAVGGTYGSLSSAVTLTNGATNYAKVNGSTTLSSSTSYAVQFIIYDSLNTQSTTPTIIEFTLPTSSVVIHSADGGNGIALGGYNTSNGADGYSRIELYLNTYLYNKLIIPSSMYGDSDPSPANAIVGQLYFQIID